MIVTTAVWEKKLFILRVMLSISSQMMKSPVQRSKQKRYNHWFFIIIFHSSQWYDTPCLCCLCKFEIYFKWMDAFWCLSVSFSFQHFFLSFPVSARANRVSIAKKREKSSKEKQEQAMAKTPKRTVTTTNRNEYEPQPSDRIFGENKKPVKVERKIYGRAPTGPFWTLQNDFQHCEMKLDVV